MKDTISFNKMYPSIMIRLFQNVPEGTKSRSVIYSLNPLKRCMTTIPVKMIPSPQLRKIPWLRHSRYICTTSNKRTTHPGYLSQKSSGRNSPLMTGSLSLSTTRRLLPRLGHHLQVIPEPYPILLGFQMVGNHEASLAIKDKKKELINQLILLMKKHVATIDSCLPWFMKPSMLLLITHPLILTKSCLSTEPT